MNRNQDPLGALGWVVAAICILAAIAFILEHLVIIVAVLLTIIGFGLGAYLVYQAIGNRPRLR